MWLLNTDTLLLESFMGAPPPYAILSHRWEERQEVGFGDVRKESWHLKGYQKIHGFCEKARQAGFTYGWVDTCCIDKGSSAELSEAINSMYAWYRDAEVCFAHLADLKTPDELEYSSWFTRGWTLQELIAPSEVRFYNKDWKLLGTKQELSSDLEKITGIPEKALSGKFRTDDYCIADKMSWSSKRRTTRKEDRAYCLLGLFNISMPMLYGEGDRAFQRLQEEIIKTSKDPSLFFWQRRSVDDFGMLAHDPSCFSAVECLPRNDNEEGSEFHTVSGWTLSNAGITMQNAVPQPYALGEAGSPIYILPMNVFCAGPEGASQGASQFGILLEKETGEDGLTTYHRVAVDGIISVNHVSQYLEVCTERQSIQISRSPLRERRTTMQGLLHLRITTGTAWTSYFYGRPANYSSSRTELKHWDLADDQHWYDERTNSLSIPGRQLRGMLAYLVLRLNNAVSIVAFLCLDYDFKPFSLVIPYAKFLRYPVFSERAIFRAHDILMKMANHPSHNRNDNVSFFDKDSLVMLSVDPHTDDLWDVCPIGLQDCPRAPRSDWPLVSTEFPKEANMGDQQGAGGPIFTFKLDCENFLRLIRPYRPPEDHQKKSLRRLVKTYQEQRDRDVTSFFEPPMFAKQRHSMFRNGEEYAKPRPANYTLSMRLFCFCTEAFFLLVDKLVDSGKYEDDVVFQTSKKDITESDNVLRDMKAMHMKDKADYVQEIIPPPAVNSPQTTSPKGDGLT